MYSCSSCREAFLPVDEIDPAQANLPPAIAALAPLFRPYLSRLLLFRCPAPACGGLVTAVYLPRTLPAVKMGGEPLSVSALPV